MTTAGLRASIGFVWIATGVLVLHPDYRSHGAHYLGMLGLPEWVMWITCVAEMALGLRLCAGPASGWITAVQVGAIGAFTLILISLDPGLLVSPFGMLSKNVPLLVLVLYVWREFRGHGGGGDRRVLRGGLAFVWIYDGILPKVVFPQAEELAVVAGSRLTPFDPELFLPVLGITQALSGVAVLLLGGGVRRFVLWGQAIGLVVLPILVSESRPDLWVHPFAPFLKNVPILAGTLFLLKKT